MTSHIGLFVKISIQGPGHEHALADGTCPQKFKKPSKTFSSPTMPETPELSLAEDVANADELEFTRDSTLTSTSQFIPENDTAVGKKLVQKQDSNTCTIEVHVTSDATEC